MAHLAPGAAGAKAFEPTIKQLLAGEFDEHDPVRDVWCLGQRVANGVGDAHAVGSILIISVFHDEVPAETPSPVIEVMVDDGSGTSRHS